MVMTHSWQYAARRHPGGWLVALATLILVLVPGCSGTSPDSAPVDTQSKVDADHFGARHLPTQRWHADRRDHPPRDEFTFEGGATVPRSDYRIWFRIRREEAHHGGHHGRHHGHVPRPIHTHGGKVLRVKVKNRSGVTWGAPVILVLDEVARDAEVYRPCGYLPSGKPYLCLQSSGTWGPGATTPKAELRFTRGRPVPFKWHLEAMPLGTTPDEPENRAPVAEAGPDQTAFVGDTVTLNGSGSADPDGDALGFSWHLDVAPAGSTAALSDVHAVNPGLAIDVPGTYELSLMVDDGLATSAPDTVRVSTVNSPPVADAGPDSAAFVGDTVTLDGTGSFDVDGDPLAFTWSLVGAPAGSAASLSDPAALMPTFTIDQSGTYEIELVVSDAIDDSATDTVFVTTLNSPPQAQAGPDQTVLLGATVDLDGGGSFDPDGDPLAWWWSLASVPPGSTAALSDPAAEAPAFTADVAGTYVAQLVVSDGAMDSLPDQVVIDTANTRPVADAGLDQSVLIDRVVTLDGGGSFDPDGDGMTFFWALTSVPPGSAAVIDAPASLSPSFTTDEPGNYMAQLIVSDGELESDPDTVVVAARVPPALSISDAAVDEGDAGTTAAVFTVTRSGSLIGDVTVDFNTSPGTASGGIDYFNASGTLTIPAGQASATITVNVVGDAVMEPDETFVVDLTNPVDATLSDAQGTGTIRNDESPSITIGDVTVTEGDSGISSAVFPVTLSGPMSVNVNIQFATLDGSAVAGSDYLATSGMLTIRAGRTSAVVAAAIVGDTTPEGTESFQVNLIDAGGVPITDGVGVATILDND
jgi:hypothetical protein